MNDLVKYLKDSGLGSLIMVTVGVGAISMAWYKYLQIKAIKQQIVINEQKVEEIENEK